MKSGNKGVKRKAKSSKSSEIEVPSIAASVRKKAVLELLDNILAEDEDSRSQISGKTLKKLKGSPLEHIFSHVRHTYAIDYASTKQEDIVLSCWTSTTGRDVRWMRQCDMKEAGVTSGVLKILNAVNDEKEKTRKKNSFFEPKEK